MIDEKELKELQEYAEYLEKRRQQIQALFDFKVEEYILDEIIDRENSTINDNIITLIRFAQVNNRLTEEQAKILINSIYKAKGIGENKKWELLKFF